MDSYMRKVGFTISKHAKASWRLWLTVPSSGSPPSLITQMSKLPEGQKQIVGVKDKPSLLETFFAINWLNYSISTSHCTIMAFKVMKLEQNVLRNII